MQFKRIELSDKAVFDKFYAGHSFLGSERAFTNSFTWQEGYNIEYAVSDDLLYLRGGFGSDAYYLMPVGSGDIKKGIDEIIKDAHDRGLKTVFRQLYEEDISILKDEYGFSVEEDRDTADYIYLVDRLITLSGKKLHAKRNFLNRFKQTEFVFENITGDNISQAKEFVLNTLSEKEDTKDEEKAVCLLLDNYEVLGQTGALIKREGRVIAVTMGESLSDETALIHLEKADPDIPGAYTAINQMFLEHCFSEKKYVNREEDMGLPGLRKAKMSYHPDILLMKYTAREV